MNRFVKFAIFFFLLTLIPMVSLSAFEDSEHFSRTFFVIRVAPHNLGYRVIYQTEAGNPVVTYLPIEWFRAAGGRATIQHMWHPSGPHMQVFWRNGEFSHLRLVVAPNFEHSSWSVVPASVDVETAFNVDTLILHY